MLGEFLGDRTLEGFDIRSFSLFCTPLGVSSLACVVSAAGTSILISSLTIVGLMIIDFIFAGFTPLSGRLFYATVGSGSLW